jgi:hypothetical protein
MPTSQSLQLRVGVDVGTQSCQRRREIVPAWRRRRLVNERTRMIGSLHADLQAVAPGLLQITRYVGNLWFLSFLTCRKDIRRHCQTNPIW